MYGFTKKEPEICTLQMKIPKKSPPEGSDFIAYF